MNSLQILTKAIVTTFLSLLWTKDALLAQSADRPKPVPFTKTEVLSKIAQVRDKVESSPIESLIAMDEATYEFSEADRIEVEFALLEAALKREDKTFDPKKVKVYINLAPPPGYDSGISPSHIKDPHERAAYEKRIRENQTLGAKVMDHHTVKLIQQRCLTSLKRRVKNADSNPAAREARDKLLQWIERSSLGESEKSEVRTSLKLSPAQK
jgi:hypothetical protein